MLRSKTRKELCWRSPFPTLTLRHSDAGPQTCGTSCRASGAEFCRAVSCQMMRTQGRFSAIGCIPEPGRRKLRASAPQISCSDTDMTGEGQGSRKGLRCAMKHFSLLYGPLDSSHRAMSSVVLGPCVRIVSSEYIAAYSWHRHDFESV